jgi:hypothetical protein
MMETGLRMASLFLQEALRLPYAVEKSIPSISGCHALLEALIDMSRLSRHLQQFNRENREPLLVRAICVIGSAQTMCSAEENAMNPRLGTAANLFYPQGTSSPRELHSTSYFQRVRTRHSLRLQSALVAYPALRYSIIRISHTLRLSSSAIGQFRLTNPLHIASPRCTTTYNCRPHVPLTVRSRCSHEAGF